MVALRMSVFSVQKDVLPSKSICVKGNSEVSNNLQSLFERCAQYERLIQYPNHNYKVDLNSLQNCA